MDWLSPAVGNIFEITNLLFLLAGVSGGILVGALPGLTGTMAIALLVPFTYGLSGDTALIMLGGVYVGAMYGGSISAILINTPGAPAAIATTFDGYPMAVNGRAEEALVTSAVSSGIGGLIGTMALLFFSPLLAAVALRFGPPEYFWLGILGLTIIASLSAKSLAKGLFGGLFGVLLSTIGMSPSTGVSRLTFNISDLLGGVEIIVALIGLFCIPQVLSMTENGKLTGGPSTLKSQPVNIMKVISTVLGRWGNIIRSSVIGVIVGIIPGAGGNVAGLLSYQEAVRASNDKNSFGQGNIEGVIASETANNAEVEGSLIPLLTLGIPGAPQAAVLYGALLLQGLRPGPELFTGRGAIITYTFILSLFLANIFMLVIGLTASKYYAKALKLPTYLLMPLVLSLSIVGSFAGRNSIFDVGIMVILGLIAYGGMKIALAPATIALGVILGPIIERGLVESMMLSRATGSLLQLFFMRPLSFVLVTMTLLSAAWPLWVKYKEHQKTTKSPTSKIATLSQKKHGALNHFGSNICLGISGIVIFAVTLLNLTDVDLQSAILPRVSVTLMAMISIGFLVKAWTIGREKKMAIETIETIDKTWNPKTVIITILITLSYVGLLNVFGFFCTSFSVLVALGFLLAPKTTTINKLPKILLSAALTCAAFYWVFVKLFNVPFPTGILF
jgi:putative tricarboxylic transport membrane protein